MDKQIISLQIPSELYTKIKADADAEFITVSAFVRKLLMQYYKEKDQCTDISIKL